MNNMEDNHIIKLMNPKVVTLEMKLVTTRETTRKSSLRINGNYRKMRDYTPRPKKGLPQNKPKAPLKRTAIKVKVTKNQKAKIKLNKEYYAKAIAANIKLNNGVCVCENCPTIIHNPTGSNVSHIISAGANTALYLDKLNHFILCAICEGVWTMHDKTTMNIYPESEERRIELNHKYYNERGK